MRYDKSNFMRFDIPIIMEFKPIKNSTAFYWGITKKFSHEGFSFESQNSNFEPNESLEIKLKFPKKETFISVICDVIWKKQIENKCIAEVKLKGMDQDAKRDFFKRISAHGNLPIDWFLYQKDYKKVAEKGKAGKLRDGKNKRSPTVKTLSITPEHTSIKKQYRETGSTCMVTFRLPGVVAADAHTVTIVGDFNDWDKESGLLNRRENGDFVITLELESGREYRYKYLIDRVRWENDWYADRYIPNTYGYDDSVVVV